MKLIVAKDYEEMSAIATNIVGSVVTANPGAVLGLTTGNTPVGLYGNLVARSSTGSLRLEHARIFCTEEYLGIEPDDPCSLFGWLQRILIAPCAIPPEHVFRLRGEDPEPQLACQEFDDQIRRAGGLDLIVESIGLNGHIGFNEPGSPPDAPSRVLALTDDTLEYNINYWNKEVPHYGLTIGLGTILSARQILLLVSGRAKAEPLTRALAGQVTPDVPASILQKAPHLTVVADKDAASLLSGLEV